MTRVAEDPAAVDAGPATKADLKASSSHRQRWVNAVLLLPILSVMGVSFFWPLATIVVRSLNEDGAAKLGSPYFGHYTDVFTDALLRQIAEQTVWLAALATLCTVVLAFPLSYLMANVGSRLASVMLVLVLIPFWVSILVRLFAFTSILGREGIINDAVTAFGREPLDLLFNTRATVIGMVAYLLPYMVLILYSAMSSVDQSLVTAARTLGATHGQAFRQIYLPQIRTATISGCLLIFVLSLGFFLTPAILGGPSNTTLPVFIQQQITIFQWGRASAAGVLLLLVSLMGYAVALRLSGLSVLAPGGRPVNRGSVAREKLHATPAVISSWVVSVAALILLIGPLVVVIPSAFGTTSTIQFPPVGLTTDWFTRVLSDPTWTGAVAKSFRVGLGTAALTTLLAVAAARGYARLRSGSLRLLVQTMAFAPVIVPVILLAIGVYDVQLRLSWVGTDVGLVLAHTVLAFPFAFLVLSNSIGKFDVSLEEAAWSMGVSRGRTFWTIVMPNQLPAVLGSLVISFMTSWDEAVVALFQAGLTKTLPVTIFSFLKSGVSPAVAAVAVLLIAPIVVAMAGWLVWTARRTTNARPS